MISEYYHWALTSSLGEQNFADRKKDMEPEWKLNTPEKLRNGAPVIYELLSDPQCYSPSRLPDGNYQP